MKRCVGHITGIAFNHDCMQRDQIDWEASANEGRVCVRYNVDPELDEKKRVYDGLSTFLVR